MKKICVYSGSNLGSRLEYKKGVKLLGKILAFFHNNDSYRKNHKKIVVPNAT